MAEKLKHRWSIGHNYMTGVTFGVWCQALAENRFHISPAYWHRAAFITLTSLLNSVIAKFEHLRFDQKIRAADITEPPVFILGHWRSGTTLLHDLLAQDDAQFNFANTYQVANPLTFLTSENMMTKAFSWLLPETRPMDNMALKFDSPQEDEFAPLLMTLKSVYLGTSFPKNEATYEKYLSFKQAALEEAEQWKQALLYFAKKLSLDDKQALLLKSPPHTARIKTILEIFPNARFVHIHRNPYRVFLSQRHFFDTAGWYTYLQRPNLAAIDNGILARYTRMYDAFFDDLSLIPEGHFHELTFDALEKDPVGQIAQVYDALAFDGFSTFEPKLQAYVSGLKDYKKNDFIDLDDTMRKKIYTHWQRNFERWQYPQ